MIKHISCVIIAKNAEPTIKKVLQALQTFEDVVVYSNNSTDETDAIAQSFSNVNLIQGEFLGFGPTKNKAATFAKNDWILSLDADEIVSSDFINNLAKLTFDKNHVYSILRKNYYKEQEIKYCWGNDILTRIYNRSYTSFTDSKVHEKIKEENLHNTLLEGAIKHYPYNTISDFILKLDRYSTIFAQEHLGRKHPTPTKAFFNGMFSFIKTYFFKRGFLDGYAGLVIAFSHMATNFYKYIKLYELNKESKSN